MYLVSRLTKRQSCYFKPVVVHANVTPPARSLALTPSWPNMPCSVQPNGQRMQCAHLWRLTIGWPWRNLEELLAPRKLDLPDRLARQAQAAELLTSRSLARLLKDAMQRRAVQQMLAGAARATATGSRPLSMKEIQAEVDAVRQARRGAKASAGT